MYEVGRPSEYFSSNWKNENAESQEAVSINFRPCQMQLRRTTTEDDLRLALMTLWCNEMRMHVGPIMCACLYNYLQISTAHRTYGSSNSNWYVKFQMFMSARAFWRVNYFVVVSCFIILKLMV